MTGQEEEEEEEEEEGDGEEEDRRPISARVTKCGLQCWRVSVRLRTVATHSKEGSRRSPAVISHRTRTSSRPPPLNS